MDKIWIRGLSVATIVGTRPEERLTPRTVTFDIELELDLRPAGIGDDLERSVNYQQVAARIVALGRETQYRLIESLAEHAAARILEEFPPVERVRIVLAKPGALTEAAAVGVAIERARDRTQ